MNTCIYFLFKPFVKKLPNASETALSMGGANIPFSQREKHNGREEELGSLLVYS